MLRTTTFAMLLWSMWLACGPSAAAAPNESKEPPTTYIVNVDGKSFTVTEGEPLKLDGTFASPKITITPAPYRVFPYQGVSFRFPRSLKFAADIADRDSKTWTLTGNSFSVYFVAMSKEIATEEYVDAVMEQLGRENCKVIDDDTKITLGTHALSGTTLQLTVGAQKVVQQFYVVPSRRPGTHLLVLQDVLDVSGEMSKEGKEALEVIQASFAVD